MNFHFIKTYLWLFSLKILKNCLEKVELGFGFNTRYTYKILMRRFTHFYILHHWILIIQGGLCLDIYFFYTYAEENFHYMLYTYHFRI